MEIQQKEQIYSQVQMMAKFTGETVNKESLFSFLDEPKTDYKSKQNIGKLNSAISNKISELVDAGLDTLQTDSLQANVQAPSGKVFMQTAALKNAMDNQRVSSAVSLKQELMAGRASREMQKAPEKVQAVAKAPSAGPSL